MRQVFSYVSPIFLVGQRLDGRRVDSARHVLLRHSYGVFSDDGLAGRRVGGDEDVLVPLQPEDGELLEVVQLEGVDAGDFGHPPLEVGNRLGRVQQHGPFRARERLRRPLGYLQHRYLFRDDLPLELGHGNGCRLSGVDFFCRFYFILHLQVGCKRRLHGQIRVTQERRGGNHRRAARGLAAVCPLDSRRQSSGVLICWRLSFCVS